jgi:hypothetical protein
MEINCVSFVLSRYIKTEKRSTFRECFYVRCAFPQSPFARSSVTPFKQLCSEGEVHGNLTVGICFSINTSPNI